MNTDVLNTKEITCDNFVVFTINRKPPVLQGGQHIIAPHCALVSCIRTEQKL